MHEVNTSNDMPHQAIDIYYMNEYVAFIRGKLDTMHATDV